MKLKELYEKLYNKIFSVKFFKMFLKIPGVEKLLQYEIVSYLFFGVMTTVVNFITYGVVNKFAGSDYEQLVLFDLMGKPFMWIYAANAIAWIVSVLFAFVTNKLFVFESTDHGVKAVIREVISFIGARIISFIVFEELLFALVVKLLGEMNNASWIAKVVSGVLVIVFNYVASKLVIFRKKKDASGEEE